MGTGGAVGDRVHRLLALLADVRLTVLLLRGSARDRAHAALGAVGASSFIDNAV